MCTDKKIETADELEFAVFCIENVAATACSRRSYIQSLHWTK